MNRDPKDRIDRFSHQYEFLSNFYPCKIIITTEKEGQLSFWSAEAAFQAMKTTDSDQRRKFCYIKDAGEAKEMGKRVRIRPDFTFARIPIMEYIVSEKFAQNGELARMLLETDKKQLIHGNIHNDHFWGMIPVPVGAYDVWMGDNHLGKILEWVRDITQTSFVSGGTPIDYPPCHMTIDDFVNRALEIMIVDNNNTPDSHNALDDERINKAVDLAWRYGNIEGDHHQKWVIDQMLRHLLTENEYARFIHDYEESGEYKWDLGIAP